MPASHRSAPEGARSFGRRSGFPVRRPLVWAGAVALALLGGNMLFGEHGLRAYLELRSERDRLQENVDVLEARHDGLAADLSDLESDDATLERIAREKYRMRREGETVIEVVGEDEGGRPGADEMDAGDS